MSYMPYVTSPTMTPGIYPSRIHYVIMISIISPHFIHSYDSQHVGRQKIHFIQFYTRNCKTRQDATINGASRY